jgi:hypothetical protein
MGILIFKRLTARRLYKSFGVKGLTCHNRKKFRGIGVRGWKVFQMLCEKIARKLI